MKRLIKTRVGPDGLHLFQRSSGTNILLDELCFAPELWSVAPRQISVALTNACDLRWVSTSRPSIRLAISESDAQGFFTCEPLSKEKGLRSYAHIDASGTLKRSSFDGAGVPIGPEGVLAALHVLEEIDGRTQ